MDNSGRRSAFIQVNINTFTAPSNAQLHLQIVTITVIVIIRSRKLFLKSNFHVYVTFHQHFAQNTLLK